MANFGIGLSALRTSQYALEVVSNNVANANNEGYHRRRVHQSTLRPNEVGGHRIGSGVEIAYIERVRDSVTESTLIHATSDSSNVDQLLIVGRKIEAAFLNGDASIAGELDALFAEITRLSSAPDEPAQRAAVVESGERIARALRQASSQLSELRASVRFQIGEEIEDLNSRMVLLSEVTTQIQLVASRGFPANSEFDERDRLLSEIAELVSVSRSDHLTGDLNIRIGHSAIQQESDPNQFHLTELQSGELAVLLDDSTRPVELESGRLTALLDSYNSTIPQYQERLETLANALIGHFDQVHATGVGPSGSFRYLTGSRAAESTVRPLDQAGLALPVQAGELTISITDSNGVRRNEVISIDPAVDTLEDVAARLGAINGLNASVNGQTQQLFISTSPNTTFDFAGRLESQPDLAGFSGTSVPEFSGTYTGNVNTTRQFTIEGSGEVGISANLFVNVLDDQGQLLDRINIGQGYEAGTAIEVGDGVEVRFSRGTVVDTEQFSTRLTHESDETRILSALGLNSFFSGDSAGSIRVNPTLQEDPDLFASSHTGDIADTANLFRFSALEDESGLPGNTTFSEYLAEINTEIGFEVSTHTSLSSSLSSLKTRLIQDRDAISGVDLNEEIVRLQQFQKSYEAAVRIIQATDNILTELFGIIR